MKSDLPLLARSRFQVFAFEVPRLTPSELETSLRLRVRSMTPLHEGQYRLWFHKERAQGRDWAYVFVTRPEQGPFRPEFPTRLPTGMPRDCVAVLSASDGPLSLLYREGTLREVVGGEPPDRWADVRRVAAAPGWGSAPVPQQALRAEPFPWFPVSLLILASLSAGAGLTVQWAGKIERNQHWKTWVAAHETVKIPAGSDWEALKKSAGIPLDDVFSQLASAWPQGVLVRNLHVDGWKLDLEADSVSGLGSFQALTAQPGFRQMALTGVRSLPNGQERLSARGEWSDGR